MHDTVVITDTSCLIALTKTETLDKLQAVDFRISPLVVREMLILSGEI